MTPSTLMHPGLNPRSTSPRHLRSLGLAVSLVLATGCATQSNSSTVYRSGETQVEQVVRMGVIESLRGVTVQRDSKGGGLIAGAVVGGVAGAGVGDGRGARQCAAGGCATTKRHGPASCCLSCPPSSAHEHSSEALQRPASLFFLFYCT